MRRLAHLIPLLLLAGCAAGPGRWSWTWGWQKSLASAAAPGQVDEEGVYQPETPEASAAFRTPDVHTGISLEVRPDPRLLPEVGVEVAEVEAPWVGRWTLQAAAGAQLADVYLGRILIPIVEITAGPWFGWDFERHKKAWGVQATIVKF